MKFLSHFQSFSFYTLYSGSLCFFQLLVLMETCLLLNSNVSSAAPQLLVFVSLDPFTCLYCHFFSSLHKKRKPALLKYTSLDYCVLPIPAFIISWLPVHSHLLIHVFNIQNIPEEYEEVIFSATDILCRIALVWNRNIYVSF